MRADSVVVSPVSSDKDAIMDMPTRRSLDWASALLDRAKAPWPSMYFRLSRSWTTSSLLPSSCRMRWITALLRPVDRAISLMPSKVFPPEKASKTCATRPVVESAGRAEVSVITFIIQSSSGVVRGGHVVAPPLRNEPHRMPLAEATSSAARKASPSAGRSPFPAIYPDAP